jgi:hypothetical protein
MDVDEAAIFFESNNHGCGKCLFSRRAKKEGPYNHIDELTAAIHGIVNEGCLIEVSSRSGTSVIDTHDFLETTSIINQFEQAGLNATAVDKTLTFTCDNLTSQNTIKHNYSRQSIRSVNAQMANLIDTLHIVGAHLEPINDTW